MPRAKQVAALPLRRDKSGALRVLLVTSRDTGRWVMPKGWEMNGRKPWAAAEIEALEEAGAKGSIWREPIGTYRYDKVLNTGRLQPCRVTIFPMVVERLLSKWKEREERRRRWCSPKWAARKVHEKDLAKLLKGLEKTVANQPKINRLLAR